MAQRPKTSLKNKKNEGAAKSSVDISKGSRAVYPGSFDPITLGHIDIIRRLSHLYDEVVVLVTESAQKKYLFSSQERMQLIEKSMEGVRSVSVDSFSGLTVEYMKKKNIPVMVRGLRAVVDFEYELTMANMNKNLDPNIETMLVFASPEYYYISSRGVKEVAQHGGRLENLVPDFVGKALMKKLKGS